MNDEPPAGRLFPLARLIGETVDDAIEDHETRCHIPPPRRGRATAIPFPNIALDDSQVCRAWEMMKQGGTLEEAALALGVPDLVLMRCLSEYQPAWQQFLQERSAGF